MTVEEILTGEAKNVEFKEKLPEKSIKYMKSVVAFANGTGGKIIFGIADKTREIVGFSREDVFKTMDAIANAVSDSCEPAIIPDAIRELIINAAVHRSYLDHGNIQVAVYDDRLEITSPGKLPMGQTLERMKEGYSQIRNEALAYAFSYMNLIEHWGSGIPRIMGRVKAAGLREPEFIGGEVDLRINIYRGQTGTNAAENSVDAAVDEDNKTAGKVPGNCRETADKAPANHRQTAGKPPENCRKTADKLPGNCRETADKPPGNCRETAGKVPAKCRQSADRLPTNEQEQRIYKYVLENGSITTVKAMELLGIKQRRAREILVKMIEGDWLKKVGASRSTIYVINTEERCRV